MDNSLIIGKLNISRLRCLSRNMIKWIAMAAMIVDHAAYQFFAEGSTGYIIGRLVIGRIAFPIFVALFVDGFFRTKHPVKHLFILFGFAVISEPCFDLLFGVQEQSVMWTWAFGWLMMLIFSKIESVFGSDPELKKQVSSTVVFFLEIGIMIVFAAVATIFNFDYIFVGMCSMGLGYLVWNDGGRNAMLFTGIIAAFVDGLCFCTYGTFLSVPVLFLYQPNAVCPYHKSLKYLFYVLYPLHLLVIVFIGWMIKA